MDTLEFLDLTSGTRYLNPIEVSSETKVSKVSMNSIKVSKVSSGF